jgi:hypothetical protein
MARNPLIPRERVVAIFILIGARAAPIATDDKIIRPTV